MSQFALKSLVPEWLLRDGIGNIYNCDIISDKCSKSWMLKLWNTTRNYATLIFKGNAAFWNSNNADQLSSMYLESSDCQQS